MAFDRNEMQPALGGLRGNDEIEASPETEFADGERPRRVGSARLECSRAQEHPLDLGRATRVVVDVAESAGNRSLLVEVDVGL